MKRIVFLFSFLSIQLTAFSQLGVGTNSPDASAQLDVTATNKGFLAPRIALTSTTDVSTITTPATGLMVYNTATAGTSPNEVTPGYYFFDGVKWVSFINSQPSATVSFSTVDPNSGSPTFSPNTPQNSGYIYVSSVNSSLWVWNGSAYVTFTSPASTPFYLTGTTTDAGGNKTSNIWRTGKVGIGINAPVTYLHLQGPTAIQSANASAQMFRMSRPSQSGVKWDNIAQFNLGTHYDSGNAMDAKSRLDIALTNGADNTTLTTVMTWLANGKVGINNTNPSSPLVVQGATGTGVLKLIAPSVAAGDNWWLGFGHGTTSTDANDRARIGADIVGGGAGRLFFTTGSAGSQVRAMFIDENQQVGIGTSVPTAQLEVATTGVGALIRRASTSLASTNLILQKTASSDPAVNTALANGDYIGRILFSAGNGTNYPLNGTDIVGYAVGAQSTTNNGGGMFFRTVPQNSVSQSIERMRIEHNGYVGIGTTSPTTNLDVVGGYSLRNVAGAAGSNYGIEFNTNSNAPRIDWVFNGAYIGQFASDANDFHLRNSKLATGGFRFYTNPAGTQVERMTILNNGNVGVNTSNPTASFHVTGVIMQDVTSQDNFSNGINIRKRGNTSSSTGAAASGAEIGYHSFYGWNGTGYARGAYVFVNAAENYTSTANGTNYSIYTTAVGSTSTVERLRIAHNGNIGIGTSNPNGALTLYGNSSMTLPANIQGQTGATKELVFGKGGLTNNFAAITGVENGQYGGGLSFIVKPTGSDNFPTSGVQAMVLDWNGNMGIGTGSPTQRLDVNGQVRIRTIAAGTSTDSLLVVNGGVVKSVAKSATVNTQTANYTLTNSDNGGILIMNSASAVTVTVPATLPAGFVVQIIQKGAGQVTVAGSGSTINSANGFKTRTLNSAIGVVMESATIGYVTGDSNF